MSRPLLSWSKRQPGPEVSPRTGGLFPTLKHRASRLVPPSDDKQNASSPVTTDYDTALANAVGNLHIAVNDMLSSRSSSVRRPPRSRPRSSSVPLAVELPAEFPGSTLLEDGAPYSSSAPTLTIPTVQATQNEDQQPQMQPVHEEIALNTSEPGAPELVPARRILGMGSSYSLRKKNHPSNAPVANVTAQSDMPKMKRNISFTAASMLRRRLDPDATKPFAGFMHTEAIKRGSKPSDQEAGMAQGYSEATSSEPSPIAAHSEHAHELESNNTFQNPAISTLERQFDSSTEACESQVNALKRWHSVQATSFETQARLYKERSNKQNLQNAASSDWLAGLRSESSPHTRIRERTQEPAIKEPTNLNTPSRCESACQKPLPPHPPTSPKTENLKLKPLGIPGLEPLTQCVQFEPSLYEQDRAALQKQIDMLTAKLSNSNKNERELRSALAMTKRESAAKTMHANKLAEKIQALHNTVAHLESRLEVSNTKRLDAEEQLLIWTYNKSPFDLTFPKQPPSTNTHQVALDIQVNTGASTYSPQKAMYASGIDCAENTTPAALIARVGELQTQAKKKDVCIAGLETKLEQLREKHGQLQHEHKRVVAQLDLQHELLRETHVSDKLIQQLRTAVINHESTIMENEQTIHALRRQLEHHKLLLQAEIRQHAAMKLYVAAEEHSLPELTSLATKENINGWMEKLHGRLREQSKNERKTAPDTPEATIESLRHEIDFYINEIVLFKLDIKGYRSDIRKLKEMIARRGSPPKLPDTEPEPSFSETSASSIESSFAPITPELDDFLGASLVMGHSDTVSRSQMCSVSSSPSTSLFGRRAGRASDQLLELKIPQDFRSSKCNHSSTNEADRVDSALSPASNGFEMLEYSKSSCSLSHFNKRSMSAPPYRLHQRNITFDRPTTGERGITSKAEWEAASYRRFITVTDPSKSLLDSQPGFSQPMDSPNSNEAVVPTLPGSCETPAAHIAPQSPVESLFETESVISTASDYFAQSAPLLEGTLGNTTASGVPVKAAEKSPRKPAYIQPPTPTHVQGCSITRCAPTGAVPFTSQSGTTMISSTHIHMPVSNNKPSREESVLKAPESTLSMLPASDDEAGIVSGPGRSWYRGLPSMLSRLHRRSASSIYSVDSFHKLSAGAKSETSMHLEKA